MVQRGFVMRILGMVVIACAFGAADARASSISIAAPLGSATSISLVGAPEDASAAVPTPGWPSITVVPDTPAGRTPSIVTLGEPADPDETATSAIPASRKPAPVVFRAGEVGQASVRPPTVSGGGTQAQAPLLDSNDRGTAGKRKALKRQAERLAREQANGAAAQPEPSTGDAPLGN